LRLDYNISALPEADIVSVWEPHDPLLQVVFWIGIGIIILSLLMLIAVFLLRIRLVMVQRRQRFFEAQWQPLLAECVFGVPAEIPQVPPKMRYHFLRVWNFHHESLAGASRANLEALAASMHLGEIARELMHTGNLRERLIAVMTIGHLRDRTQWHELRDLVAHPSPMLSLLAARALIDIDAPSTLAWLITVMAARDDWPLSRVVTILREVGPDLVTLPLIGAAEAAARGEGGDTQVARLLKMMEVAHIEHVSPFVGKIAREDKSPELIASALRLMQDPRDLDIVRIHTKHESWFVRATAIQTLGRIGGKSDMQFLIDMLSDTHWWVRYRAARALLALPDMPLDVVDHACGKLQDHFAADILAQAIAEARAA
jgi:hypothetical protein